MRQVSLLSPMEVETCRGTESLLLMEMEAVNALAHDLFEVGAA